MHFTPDGVHLTRQEYNDIRSHIKRLEATTRGYGAELNESRPRLAELEELKKQYEQLITLKNALIFKYQLRNTYPAQVPMEDIDAAYDAAMTDVQEKH